MLRHVLFYSLISFFVLTAVNPHKLFAQSIWLDRSHDKTIALEILKPSFERDHTTFATAAYLLSGRFSMENNLSVVADLPFAHSGYDSDYYDVESENALGNPYVGIELNNANSPIIAELGLRLPLAPTEDGVRAARIGMVTEFVDRVEAYITDALPLIGAVNFYYKEPSGFIFRVRGGSAFMFAIGDRDDSELFFLYSAQAGYESSKIGFIAGVSGRMILTEDDADFGERTLHQFGLAANVAIGAVRPGISVKIPLDENMQDMFDVVIGLSLGINLK